MPSAFESARARFQGQILADLLAKQGPLSLDLALRYATEIALLLREMHQDGRSHGGVDPEHVVLKSSGASLLSAERRGYPDPIEDLTGFGAVLYAMLTGKEPSGEFRLVPPKPGAIKGVSTIRSSAIRLAERCFSAERESAPDFQKVLTEVRLLSVMAKQLGTDHRDLHLPPPPPAPISFPPPQPLAVFAGKATPVINPPGRPMPVPVPPPPPPPEPDSEAEVEADADVADPITVEPEHPTPDPSKPGEHSPQTKRAKGSHSRPVLKDVACPKCKGFHVRLSRPRTRFERFLNLLGVGVHRCHRCFYRYIPIFGRKIVRKSK